MWSWDITYLKAPVAGAFYYLYLFMDVWSREPVAWEVHDCESEDRSSALLERTLKARGLSKVSLVLHSDNGHPMKGATMKATMERLGVLPSFSRPRVSNDNPFSESLFCTLKYRPGYPKKPFESLDAAGAWVTDFVAWYNHEHLHSAIGYVTPSDRHKGRDQAILARRRATYEAARKLMPERWAGRAARAWEAPCDVVLNPATLTPLPASNAKIAA